MADDDLTISTDAGRMVIRFERPEALNALTADMLVTATARLRAAAHDPNVRAVVISGAGRAFSSGADIGRPVRTDLPRAATLDAANEFVSAIVDTPRPVVAAVNGLATGVGATIAFACDLQVVRRSAYFQLAFTRIGLMPDAGSTAIIPAVIGRARTVRMALLAERVSATQAFDWGLISHISDDHAFDTDVEAVVSELAHGPTLAYARLKHALRSSTLRSLDLAQALERKAQLELFDTTDYEEGRAAFRERRAAEFQGR